MGIAVFIAALPSTLRAFIREITVFENKHSITNQLRSAVTKMWTVQYVASAFGLLAINGKYKVIEVPKEFPILNGDYDDFTYEWYTVVGTLICSSTFISALIPIGNLAFWVEKGFWRCKDRGWTCDMKKT